MEAVNRSLRCGKSCGFDSFVKSCKIFLYDYDYHMNGFHFGGTYMKNQHC